MNTPEGAEPGVRRDSLYYTQRLENEAKAALDATIANFELGSATKDDVAELREVWLNLKSEREGLERGGE